MIVALAVCHVNGGAAGLVVCPRPRAEADSVSAKAAGDIAVHANLATKAIDEALNSWTTRSNRIDLMQWQSPGALPLVLRDPLEDPSEEQIQFGDVRRGRFGGLRLAFALLAQQRFESARRLRRLQRSVSEQPDERMKR